MPLQVYAIGIYLDAAATAASLASLKAAAAAAGSLKKEPAAYEARSLPSPQNM